MTLHLCFIKTILGSLKQAWSTGFTAVSISISGVAVYKNFPDHLSLTLFMFLMEFLKETICLFPMKLLDLLWFVIRLEMSLEDC